MGKKTKVVLDTNVIISAFGWHGIPKDVISLMRGGKIQNFTSLEILDELKRVAGYPKLGFPEEIQIEILETIYNASTLVSLKGALRVVNKDPDDNMILECASVGDVEYIISGDKHLLDLVNFSDITILTPEDFMKNWSFKNENI